NPGGTTKKACSMNKLFLFYPPTTLHLFRPIHPIEFSMKDIAAISTLSASLEMNSIIKHS
ncbi:hypothetical protein, partial [Sphingobacterium multivorum]|uniref:hypothetical protein n=1 Tax=Sphingobacterium multivorum TaxID=28454 RepID=UPI0028A890B9